MSIDLDNLEAVARAAPDGNWISIEDHDHSWWCSVWVGDDTIAGMANRQTADHIATCDPPTVLALIAEIRRLREAITDVALRSFEQGSLAARESGDDE